MAAHFSILAWKIPWTEERGRLQSMGLERDATKHTHIQKLNMLSHHCLALGVFQEVGLC